MELLMWKVGIFPLIFSIFGEHEKLVELTEYLSYIKNIEKVPKGTALNNE